MREKRIKEIHDLWKGAFIRGDNAMQLIGEELKKETIQVNSVKFFADGELITEVDEGSITYETLT